MVVPPASILFPFVGDTIGGSHLSTLVLIDGLDRQFFKPIVLLHQEGPLSRYLDSRRVPYDLAPEVALVGNGRVHKLLLAAIRCLPALSPFLSTHRIAAVHTNDLRMHLTWGLAARYAGARFIWHQHTMTSFGRTEVFTNLANTIIVISEYCRRSYVGRARHRAQTISNPVYRGEPQYDRVAARATVMKQISANARTHLIAFIGNLRVQKRPQIFIEAAARLRDHFGDGVMCLMFGEERPPIAEEVRTRIAALGMQKNCKLMGPRFPIEPWLAGCDLLLAPAVNEGFGRTLVEAMLVGTPVVATAAGGHAEIIEHASTGILTPEDDPASLSDAAIELLEDRAQAAAIAARARLVAVQKYSVDSHVAAVQRVYRDLKL